jgi:hypothetical protein
MPEYIEREKKKEQSAILLPDDYSKVEGRHCTATVLSWASDCRLELSENGSILVDRSMIEEIEHSGEKYYLILDNYVLAKITKENK